MDHSLYGYIINWEFKITGGWLSFVANNIEERGSFTRSQTLMGSGRSLIAKNKQNSPLFIVVPPMGP